MFFFSFQKVKLGKVKLGQSVPIIEVKGVLGSISVIM